MPFRIRQRTVSRHGDADANRKLRNLVIRRNLSPMRSRGGEKLMKRRDFMAGLGIAVALPAISRAQQTPTIGFLSTRSPDIHFVVRGTDDPTLIFVHGFGCSLDDWEEQFRDLSPRSVALRSIFPVTAIHRSRRPFR